jgi:hypothetical protein
MTMAQGGAVASRRIPARSGFSPLAGADEAGGVVTVAGPENSSFSLVTMKEG